MEKRLKKYTTVPQHLYVNRSADEQLKRIVDEMQRPGYVLVARQMGKTNLLFNAKRVLESENRLFVYVDFSNVFDSEHGCYRNIIDFILEPNQSLFESIESKIYELREKNLPAHQEYSRSLRIILKHFQGNIVIILDEIDALRDASYSDNIFAQIRSNYFSRTNFPEFERLTYVLSGVIEPSELIKDRNKSPFNIGDKIYLDDFSREEHDSFIEMSELAISNDISDTIYTWANGNPRLTFDICSEIESFLMQNETISKEELDSLVKKKYLTTFDIAPIDHIRELVKSNKKVRDAVSKIQQNKADDLSDEIKKELYLYGIINSKFDEKISIKNLVIKFSLSKDWIESIDKQNKDNFNYGIDKITEGEFEEGIIALLDFIENSTPTKQQVETCNYHLGLAYYKTKDFKNAILYFSEKYKIMKLYARNSESLLGCCKIKIENKEEGIAILEKFILNEIHDYPYRNALLNLATNLDRTQNDRAIKLYKKLFDSTFKAEDSKEYDLSQLRALSLYYQSEIYLRKKEISKALERINLALKYANLSDSLYFKLLKYNLSEQKEESFKAEIVETIIDNNLKFDIKNSYQFSFKRPHLLEYLGLVFDISDNELFEKLLNYTEKNLFDGELAKFELIYAASMPPDSRESILKYLLSFKAEIKTDLLLNIYRDLSLLYSNNPSSFFTHFNKYESIFRQTQEIVSKDIYLLALGIKHYYDAQEITKGLLLCQSIDTKIKNIEDEALKFETLIIYFWYSMLHFAKGNKVKAGQYADKTIKLIRESKRKRTSVVDEKGVESVFEQMQQIKRSSIILKPVMSQKSYGRNDTIKVKYSNGRVVEKKYKKLEADILAQRCTIM